MRVLLAEDDPISRKLLETYLQKWGHEVTSAPSGDEAWEFFQSADYHLVISDWMMPGMDGPELISRIRAAGRSAYVYTILLTARAQRDDLVKGMESGADDFISKPFDRDELRVRIRAGERIVRLERELASQNRALREALGRALESEEEEEEEDDDTQAHIPPRDVGPARPASAAE